MQDAGTCYAVLADLYYMLCSVGANNVVIIN